MVFTLLQQNTFIRMENMILGAATDDHLAEIMDWLEVLCHYADLRRLELERILKGIEK